MIAIVAIVAGFTGTGLQIFLQIWEKRHRGMDDRWYWGLLSLGVLLMALGVLYGLGKLALAVPLTRQWLKHQKWVPPRLVAAKVIPVAIPPGGDRSALGSDVRIIIRPDPGNNLTGSVTFTTEGEKGQLFNNLGGRPSALRFVTLGGRIVREADLPVEIPCGGGKLIIKWFSDGGFGWDEEGTIGDRVKVQFYPSATSTP